MAEGVGGIKTVELKLPFSSQFRIGRTPSGKKAFEAWTAIWGNYGNNVAISAPSLEALRHAWWQITGQELIADGVQHVWIVKAEKEAEKQGGK
jgi:hypothetical protein